MGIRDTLARLAATDSDPQARTERITWRGSETIRETPDAGDIEDYVVDYRECALARTGIDTFTNDVLAPGYRFETDADGAAEDLESFFSNAAIVGGEYNRDITDLWELQIRDNRVRGDGLAEVAYRDRRRAERIEAFRLFPSETVTAYTHPGTGILLRPDDDPREVRINNTTRTVPTTAAGKTAAFVQFDDVFGTNENDEVAFAQDDVVKLSNNVQTGDVWGISDLKPAHDRIRGFLQKLKDVDVAIHSKGYPFWHITVGDGDSTQADLELAKSFMQEQDPENWGPGKKQATPGAVDIQTVSGEVPDVWPSIETDVEYIVSALPVPKYRIGWEDDINRDIAAREQEDYDRELRRERRKLEAAWQPVVDRVAEQLGYESVDVTLKIEEEEDTNPLRQEWFEASEFKALMDGLKAAAPGGATDAILPPEEILDMLGLDAEAIDLPADEPLDESDPEVQQAAEELRALADGGLTDSNDE